MYCEERIVEIPNFIRHLQKMHKYRDKFVCTHCQVLFQDDESLQEHLMENKCKEGWLISLRFVCAMAQHVIV